MGDHIMRDVTRPPETTVEALQGRSAADVHEAMNKTGAMAPEISRATGDYVCGPATTVRLPTGDNMMIHVGANVAQPGDVLVIEATTTSAATWGELATRNALRKGLEGVVSSGNVRDTETIDALGFTVFGKAVSHIGAVKETPGWVNVPVSVGDQIVNPGDVVVGDADGVTVVPKEDAAEVAQAVADHEAKEDEIRQRIEDGESLFDIAGFEDLLAEHGIELPAPSSDET
jgi:4-hydroxy-4-methyl-2-oxoglutarate aldolase